MKKTVSVLYTVFVVVLLLCAAAFLGWRTWELRSARISDFETRSSEYTRRLSETLTTHRDVSRELLTAEELMNEDPALIAIQVFSHDDGLRLSVVKPSASAYARTAISVGDSNAFQGLTERIRYHKISRPMNISDMQGLEAVYVSAVLPEAGLRRNLVIMLSAVASMFILTLILILIQSPGSAASRSAAEPEPPAEEPAVDFSEGFSDMPDMTDFPDIPDIPDMPEEHSWEPDGQQAHTDAFKDRLEVELERSASFNQDLSLLIFSGRIDAEELIHSSYTYKDLVFSLDDGTVAVIEINRDLDSALSLTEDFIKHCIEQTGSRNMRVGIASRNGRLISADRLFTEAEKALRKTNEAKNIVAFRSNPEKYRQFLKSQEA